MAVLFAIGEMFLDAPEAGTVAVSASWYLPGFVVALPLAIHWFADPPRRATGLGAALAAGVVVALAVTPLVVATGWTVLWAGLLTMTAGALTAAAVFGTVAPTAARP